PVNNLKRPYSENLNEEQLVIKKPKRGESPIESAQSTINNSSNVNRPSLNNTNEQSQNWISTLVSTCYNKLFTVDPFITTQGKIKWELGEYEGSIRDGKPEGKGKYTAFTGATHEGDYVNGKLHGYGEIKFSQYKVINTLRSHDNKFQNITDLFTFTYYKGEFSQGQFHGKGKWDQRPRSGTLYKGQFQNGSKHGIGKETSQAGSTYKGVWEKNKVIVIRKATFLDGTVYKGSFLDKDLHGPGKRLMPNNSSFKGYFQAGKLNGFGKEVSSLGLIIYQGSYQKDRRHGQGTFRFNTGDVFDGLFDHGSMVAGTMKYQNGIVYIGKFEDARPNGPGKLIQNGSIYEGQFINGLIYGPGTQTDQTGKLIYKGDYIFGARHGQGLRFFDNGDVYTGQFQAHEMTGQGKITFQNGFYCIGTFLNGKLHGNGTDHAPNGKIIYDGEHKLGKCHGQGKYYLDNGDIIKGNFKTEK
nr:hypothetical protein [Parachlamydiaceae bacterium]